MAGDNKKEKTMALSQEQLSQLQDRLRARLTELRGLIQRELEDAGHDSLAGQVHDTGEAALADQLVGLDVAIAEIDTQELMDIRAAMDRLEEGRYGICVDCGVEIGFARFKSQPTAARCIDCQERFEMNSAVETPRL